ncbi:vitamin K epoxide reductase family protein [Rothia kristinae]|uniref:vitamin K epoxide reductase family protein n=1 Tax=Rothia kristinae TaxID=37923 RepID=UPI002F2B4318
MSAAVTELPEDSAAEGNETLPQRRHLAWLMVVTGAVGFFAAAMLVWERLQIYVDAGHVSSCDLNSLVNCGTVMRTSQAAAFGFPNPLIGIVAYAIILTIATAMLAGARLARWYWWCVQIGVTLGFVFICWLWYQTTFRIDALCLYCMIVWIMQTTLFVHVTVHNMRTGVIPVPRRVASAMTGWAWFLTVMILLVLFGIIFIRFFSVIMGMF